MILNRNQTEESVSMTKSTIILKRASNVDINLQKENLEKQT